MTDLSVCVVGAGVVGLTTALELQKEFRNAKITVMAEKFHKDTTSYVAAGLFLPSPSFMGPSVDVTREWVHTSFHYWDDLLKTHGGTQVGIMEMSGYLFSSLIDVGTVKNHYVENLLPVYRRATKEELGLSAQPWQYGSFMSTLIIENDIYLPWAKNKFVSNNGNVVMHKIDELSELAGKYDVVVNCTGLGARFLCQDIQVVPIRGQILKVRAPWIDKFYLDLLDTYIIPGFEGVTLGGTRQYDNYDLSWNKYNELEIKEKCEQLAPMIKGYTVIDKRVGLRPHRSSCRVEPEIILVYQSKLKVVHNYGHCGYGVTTAPGTAKHAVRLVREMLMTRSKI